MRPLTPNATVESFGFVRMTTTSGGICFVKEEPEDEKQAASAGTVEEMGKVAVVEEDKVEEKREAVKMETSIKVSPPFSARPGPSPFPTEWTLADFPSLAHLL